MRLPNILQRSGHDCADACVQIIFTYHNKKYPPSLSTPVDGTDPRTLEAAFRRAGFKVISGEMGINDLSHFCKQGFPVVALIQHNAVGHYVVIEKVTNCRVYFQCPLDGPTKVTTQNFLDRWRDFDRLGGTFRYWGVVAWEER